MKRPCSGVEFGRDGGSSPWAKTISNGSENYVVVVVAWEPVIVSIMASNPQQSNGRDGTLSSALDVVIQTLALAKDTCGIPPAQIALGSAVALLTMIRVHFPFRLTATNS